MIELDLITSNPGKLKEFRSALEPLGFEVRHLPEEVDEIQADTLEEVVQGCVAQLKARGLRNFVLDDSGLFIDELNGFPGVYSSYVFRTLGCEGILKLLQGKSNRAARFECCIGCSIERMGQFTVKELSKGRIIHEMRGREGFGYDPIFVPAGKERTYAEMGLEEKNELSHRGKAIKSFARQLAKGMEGERR